MSINLQLAEGQIYKEIIKSPIIYRGDHSKVRAKDHNGIKVILEKLSDWFIRKSGI
ncbi:MULTISPECIES: hypothetical protein [Dolichospermum]|uniref:Uncharacterized protein n=1 Tax=Dolichospermum heterosporum TAC447 TaxID=747523 RepID=A0ABY5LV66_9CYAN|nr:MULTISPECIES: hypothetical protein [Dolichospermum]MDK2413008.1 hypothetical protein [Aphanizomenon sp. 202]MDK2460729.1 hypothetical protein [Aphanizomenon sp. PH219]UUO14694.1 hypothetical protein NG743_22120 [Dolichospermum heterosporum TAC447]